VLHTPAENEAEILGSIGSIEYSRQDFTVYEFDQNKDLWWFEGEDPESDYQPVRAILTVKGLGSSGDFQWEITQGDSIVEFMDGEQGTSSFLVNGDPTAQLRSKGASAEAPELAPDVTVEFTRNGQVIAIVLGNVFTPSRMIPLQIVPVAFGNGHRTTITYTVVNQFGGLVFPGTLPSNEDIDGNGQPSTAQQVSDAAESVWTVANQKDCNENWGWGAESSLHYGEGVLTDVIQRSGTPPLTCPEPQNPQDPLGNQEVDRSPQGAIYIGSSVPGRGKKVRDVKWHIFRDHAEHSPW
jgi:hypothetical protein